MPLQNRVTPSGEIVADPGRGLMMGNRGCLHGQGRSLGVSRWRSKLWIWGLTPWAPGRDQAGQPGCGRLVAPPARTMPAGPIWNRRTSGSW
jgi:hypothetical protein